jgi:proteasome alpha subunit
LDASQLEVAVLDRQRPRRTFRRIAGPLLEDLLNSESPVSDAPVVDDGRPGHHDVLTGEVPTPETPGTAQPPPADDDPGHRKEPL